jgi:hypothetical protein
VIVQPNFHIVALGQLPEITLMELDRVADRLSADRAVEYELTRESVYRGQRSGVTAGDLIVWLGRIAAEPLPQNVVRTLEQWQESHERIVIRVRSGLLQAADAELLSDLVEASDGALRSLSPTFAEVANTDGLRELLSSRNVQPVQPVQRHADRGAAGATLDADGYVSFRQRVPDIYLLGRLQRLTEWDADRSAWRLTRSSVRRARSRFAMDAAAQFTSWRTVLVTEPPDWLEQRLKAWGGFYGDARLRRTVLLELPSEQALDELLENDDLRDRLQRFEPQGPLVSVGEEDIEELRALLDEYGIELTED